MLKMAMALPMHIDGEKFMEMTMDIIKGRYGKDGFYSGYSPFASVVIRPEKISAEFARGYSGKNGLHYYTIDADELDPVIIATMEEIGEMVGMNWRWVGANVDKDFWKPEGNFQNAPHYYDGESVMNARENYFDMLKLLGM